MTTSRGRVVVVEDHLLLAQSLQLTLGTEGFEVSAVPVPTTSVNPLALLPRVQEERPDAVLLDLDLGTAGDGAQLIEPLHQAGTPVLVVTGVTDHARWGECLAHGAGAVLHKTAPLPHIARALREILAGRVLTPPEVRRELVRRWHTHRRVDHGVRSRLDRLSRREAQVLESLAAGKRVPDIAAESFVAESTVRSQVKAILAKLGVTSQIAAVAMLRKAGDPSPTWGKTAPEPSGRPHRGP